MPEKPEEIEEALRDIRAALRRIDRVLDGTCQRQWDTLRD